MRQLLCTSGAQNDRQDMCDNDKQALVSYGICVPEQSDLDRLFKFMPAPSVVKAGARQVNHRPRPMLDAKTVDNTKATVTEHTVELEAALTE